LNDAAAGRAFGALMPPQPHGIRASVGRVLRAGVAISATMLAAGYVVALLRSPRRLTSHVVERAHLAGNVPFPHSFPALWDALGHGSGDAVIVLGILLLILTPVAGLVAAVVGFAVRRDWMFAAISLTVLLVITTSAIVGVLTN
jgi:uncharacterized membrane protein